MAGKKEQSATSETKEVVEKIPSDSEKKAVVEQNAVDSDKSDRKPLEVVRMLRDTPFEGDLLRCNELIEADDAVLSRLVDQGVADASDSAVDYCLSQGVSPREILAAANAPSEGTYLLNKGERVLHPEQNEDLKNFLSGGGSANGDVIEQIK